MKHHDNTENLFLWMLNLSFDLRSKLKKVQIKVERVRAKKFFWEDVFIEIKWHKDSSNYKLLVETRVVNFIKKYFRLNIVYYL